MKRGRRRCEWWLIKLITEEFARKIKVCWLKVVAVLISSFKIKFRRFFWAPICKWGLVIAGIKDLTRPAELLSIEQTVAIGITGFIYSRFSMVIKPKNYTLLSVNVFVAITQSIQLYRALRYKYEIRNKKLIMNC